MNTEFTLQSSVNYPVGLYIEPPATPAIQGNRSITPYVVHLSAEDVGPHTISLYAQNSKSSPPVQPHKWSHLIPQWRFTDTAGELITSITPTIVRTVTAGDTISVYATGAFYFIDDFPTDYCSPVVLWAVVDFSQYPVYLDEDFNATTSPGYANSKVAANAFAVINSAPVIGMDITREGTADMFPTYWRNTTIPFTVAIRGNGEVFGVDHDPILFQLPQTNSIGVSSGLVDLYINAPIDSITWETSSFYFSAFDAQQFEVGGYYRNSIVGSTAIIGAQISGSGNMYIPPQPFVNGTLWISNPKGNTLNRVTPAPCVSSTLLNEITSYLDEHEITLASSATVFDITNLQTSAVDVMGLSGFGGIYGMALTPASELWAADAENDKVYKLSSSGALLSTIDLEQGSTPGSISLDSTGHAWVAFFDAQSAIKLNPDTGSIVATIDLGYPAPTLDPLYSLAPSAADIVYKPTMVDVDINDNIWIAYNNTMYSELRRYDPSGSLLNTITLPTCSNPMDVFATGTDAWVSLTYHSGPPYLNGAVQKYNSSGTLLSSITAVHPEYITVDMQEGVWFTHNWNQVGHVTVDNIRTDYTIGPNIPSALDVSDQLEFNALEGITADSVGNVWIINSYNNVLYIITNGAVYPSILIEPKVDVTYYNTLGYTTTAVDEFSKSAQAFGDWNGYRWIKKYTYLPPNVTELISLSGVSAPFDIIDYANMEMRKFNESWNAGPEVRKLALPEHINRNEILWGQYMNAVWGDAADPYADAFGRQVYEKIANFSNNNVDIEECNIEQLYSLAQAVDVPIDNYRLSFPAELRRLMDLVSINQQKLWGARCGCRENITHTYTTTIIDGVSSADNYLCDRCGHEHPGNRGDLFNPLTYMVSANVPFIVRDKYLEGDITLVTPPASSVSLSGVGGDCSSLEYTTTYINTYPLSAAYTWLLPGVVTNSLEPTEAEFLSINGQYCFYNYIDVPCTEQIAGVVNWDDEYTTYNETVSGIDEWYGDNGSIEKMFNYIIHKGLGLIQE